ncbi:MAG: TonB-dependent receptor, partial [Lewinella sp.]|nr:TonB-dependent receptor [Lewinella sp.]
MKRNLLVVLLFLLGTAYLGAQTSLSGKVKEGDTGEPIIFGTVVLYQNGVQKGGTETDFDGNYNFASLDPGTYDVEFSYVGFQTQRITGVVVFDGKANKLDAELNSGVMLTEIEVVGYKVPLVEQDNTTQGATITSEQIRSLPTRNINALAATTAGLSSADEGSAVTIRGSRSNATNYYVDGMRVQGSLIPESEIDQLQVITGGVEARYGDVTGGIISITTKGPSNQFSGGVEAETSQYLDAYNNSLLGLNLSGPILRNKQGVSVLGYRFAGRYTYRQDDNPPAVPIYRAKDEVIKDLEANPVIPFSGSDFVAADFINNDDVEALDAQPYEASSLIDLTGKLDARFSDAIDVTFSGAYRNSENQFTPGGWRLLNSHNNPISYGENLRVNFRFRHRLGGSPVTGPANDDRRVSTIQNATYTLQAMYEDRSSEVYDPRHEFNYFDYGYVGQFQVDYIPVFGVEVDSLDN